MIFYLLLQVMYSVFYVVPSAEVKCTGYYLLYAVT